MLKVLPYKPGSASANSIVATLEGAAIIKRQRTPMKGKKWLLNWGHSAIAFDTARSIVLNRPEAVANASNKLTAFAKMAAAGVNIPEFTHDLEIAKGWINEDRIVLCRKLLRANSGRGIVVAKTLEELVTAPLYVKYIRKEKEYRLHV